MAKKNSQINIRCNSTDKEKAKAILDQYNKNWDFLLDFFLRCFNEATGSLKIEKQILEAEVEAEIKELKLKEFELKNKQLRLKTIDETINNSSIYNLDNYKYNTAITNAVESIKELLANTHSKYKTVEDIPEEVYITKANNFKLNDVDLLKSIVKEEFSTNWKYELTTSSIDKATKEGKLKELEINILTAFNNKRQRKNNLFDYVEEDKERILKRCDSKNIRFKDLIQHLEDLPEEKKHK